MTVTQFDFDLAAKALDRLRRWFSINGRPGPRVTLGEILTLSIVFPPHEFTLGPGDSPVKALLREGWQFAQLEGALDDLVGAGVAALEADMKSADAGVVVSLRKDLLTPRSLRSRIRRHSSVPARTTETACLARSASAHGRF